MVRRLSLVAALLAVPPLLTWFMYVGSQALLAATQRTISPNVLLYAAAIELVAFFLVGVLEVKDRW